MSTINESEPNKKRKRKIKVFTKPDRDYSDCGASYGGSPTRLTSLSPVKLTEVSNMKKEDKFRIGPEQCPPSPFPILTNEDSDDSSKPRKSRTPLI